VIIDHPPNIFAENIGISAGNKEIIAYGNVILYAKSPAGASHRPTMLIENYTKKILLLQTEIDRSNAPVNFSAPLGHCVWIQFAIVTAP